MERFRAFALAAAVAASLLLSIGAGTAAAATTCGTVDGARWCNAPATDYPSTSGWYGYVGVGGGPCNMNPKGTTFAPGIVGACAVPPPETVWRWTGAGWTRTQLYDGARGYVHPYTRDWRWIWVDKAWYAISAQRLTLEWRA